MSKRSHSTINKKEDTNRVNKPNPKNTSTRTAVIDSRHPLQRAFQYPNSLTSADAQALQRTIGNQALRRLIIQRKMTVGPVGDKYEQEADAVAKQVVSKLQATSMQTAPAQTAQRQEEEELQMKPLIQRQEEEELQMKPLPIISSLQRQEEEELQMKPLVQRQEEEELQAKSETTKGDPMLAGGELSGSVESSVQRAKSSGHPMSDNIRAPMEQAFNADFSRVKVHTGAESDTLNRSLSARAFTSGHDVFFRQGEYKPSSTAGQELLAHELTHVVQQRGTAVQRQESPITDNVLQLKRAYRGLNSRFHGNNDLRVLNKTNYHVTVPDPDRTLEFDEFHITYENNSEGRQAHFFYSDKPKYQLNGEEHAQNQYYRSDANQEESSLTAFKTLKTESKTKATAFIQEVETAEKELAARLKAEKIAKEKQAKANNAFAQGKNGLVVESRFKDPAPGQSVWGAKKVKYTQQEAQEITRRVLALLPNGTTMEQINPIDNGEKFVIKFAMNDIRVDGPAAIDAAMDDPSVATAEYTKL